MLRSQLLSPGPLRVLCLLLPTRNQLKKALRSSVLNLLQPRIVNHLRRMRNRCHHVPAAFRSSSFVGLRCAPESSLDARIKRRMNGEYSWILPGGGGKAGGAALPSGQLAHLPPSFGLGGAVELNRRGKRRGMEVGSFELEVAACFVKKAWMVRYRSA